MMSSSDTVGTFGMSLLKYRIAHFRAVSLVVVESWVAGGVALTGGGGVAVLAGVSSWLPASSNSPFESNCQP